MKVLILISLVALFMCCMRASNDRYGNTPSREEYVYDSIDKNGLSGCVVAHRQEIATIMKNALDSTWNVLQVTHSQQSSFKNLQARAKEIGFEFDTSNCRADKRNFNERFWINWSPGFDTVTIHLIKWYRGDTYMYLSRSPNFKF